MTECILRGILLPLQVLSYFYFPVFLPIILLNGCHGFLSGFLWLGETLLMSAIQLAMEHGQVCFLVWRQQKLKEQGSVSPDTLKGERRYMQISFEEPFSAGLLEKEQTCPSKLLVKSWGLRWKSAPTLQIYSLVVKVTPHLANVLKGPQT